MIWYTWTSGGCHPHNTESKAVIQSEELKQKDGNNDATEFSPSFARRLAKTSRAATEKPHWLLLCLFPLFLLSPTFHEGLKSSPTAVAELATCVRQGRKWKRYSAIPHSWILCCGLSIFADINGKWSFIVVSFIPKFIFPKCIRTITEPNKCWKFGEIILFSSTLTSSWRE